ncbi:hypothetical protein [Streptomyces sp. NPDC048196]|uniref:hypothetical protein n=1 Tax=Streptomyces sp. NPDC048196 TaxID=3154712 RepID=UPI0033F8F8F7
MKVSRPPDALAAKAPPPTRASPTAMAQDWAVVVFLGLLGGGMIVTLLNGALAGLW